MIFIVGLVAGIALIKEIGAPLMGVSLLLGLATIGSRLWSGEALMPEPAAV